jgi:3-oxoacyl-[acyl-carrier protein] reductase
VVADIVRRDGRALAIQADVSKRDDVVRLFTETRRALGPVDVLVNNAGVYRFAPVEDVVEDEFHRQFGTNVLGPLLAIQEAVKQFGDKGGSIINVGSSASRSPTPQSVVYSATKHALDGITAVLAQELGARKIRVNSLNPGPVETEGTHAGGLIGSEFMKQMIARVPLGRIAQPQDIGPAAVFLASDDSAWLTGELLYASGGLR